MKSPILIYDGECEFCRQSLTWMRKKVEVQAFPFQSYDTDQHGLSKERCSKEVILIVDGKISGGADAIALLLHQRGNKLLSFAIKASGGLAHAGYRWIATHRNLLPVRLATKALRFFNK